MDFSTVINDVLTSVIIAAIGVLGTLTIKYIQKGIAWLKSKTTNETLASILNRLNDATADAVQSVEATLVEAAKNSGTWDSEAKKNAFNTAFNSILLTLGDDAIAFIANSKIDITALIKNKIEALNQELNSGDATDGKV